MVRRKGAVIVKKFIKLPGGKLGPSSLYHGEKIGPSAGDCLVSINGLSISHILKNKGHENTAVDTNEKFSDVMDELKIQTEQRILEFSTSRSEKDGFSILRQGPFIEVNLKPSAAGLGMLLRDKHVRSGVLVFVK